jgi:membrane peptidoglycan carboxypeptidase
VNYGDLSWGPISLLRATEDSVNSAYVQVSQEVGYDAVVEAAVRAGVPRDTPALEPVRTVALGVASPHVIDMASAYATFAAGGSAVTPTVLTEVVGANEGVLLAPAPVAKEQFSPEVAETVNYALQKVATDGTGAVAQGLGRPAAVKTGTTNGNRSAWFAGYTPQLATAVMFVRDGKDGNPASLAGLGGGGTVTGGNFPGRLWTAFMKGALEGQPVEEFPTSAPIPTAEPTEPSATPTESSASPTPTESSASPTPTPTPTGSSTSAAPSASGAAGPAPPGGGGAGGD